MSHKQYGVALACVLCDSNSKTHEVGSTRRCSRVSALRGWCSSTLGIIRPAQVCHWLCICWVMYRYWHACYL